MSGRSASDIEWSLLGCCAIGGAFVLSQVSAVLTPSDFAEPTLAATYAAMQEIDTAGARVDRATLRSALEGRGIGVTFSLTEYLDTLYNVVPSAANALWYAKQVKERAVWDKTCGELESLRAETEVWDGTSAEFLETAQRRLLTLDVREDQEESAAIADTLPGHWEALWEHYDSPRALKGITTGFAQINYCTSGLCKGRLYILAARPKVGKTSLALDIARNAAYEDAAPVQIFSLEMTCDEVQDRLLFQSAKVDSGRMFHRTIRDVDRQSLEAAKAHLSALPLYIHDKVRTLPKLTAVCRRAKFAGLLSLVVVDYLQLLSLGSSRIENRQQEVAQITRGLKEMAVELDVPVLALSQLNRAVESRADKTPALHDLRESGALEQDANLVAFLYANQKTDEGDFLTSSDPPKWDGEERHGLAYVFDIAANRHGAAARVPLTFFPAYTRFESFSEEY